MWVWTAIVACVAGDLDSPVKVLGVDVLLHLDHVSSGTLFAFFVAGKIVGFVAILAIDLEGCAHELHRRDDFAGWRSGHGLNVFKHFFGRWIVLLNGSDTRERE